MSEKKILVFRTLIVFWVSSIIGYFYASLTEPFAISLGFREPYGVLGFMAVASGFGFMGIMIYLYHIGVIQDKDDSNKTSRQKLGEFLGGVLAALIVLAIFVIVKVLL